MLVVGLLACPFTEAAAQARRELGGLVKQRVGRVSLLDTKYFYGDFNGDGQEDALVFGYFADPAGGNSFMLKVLLFRGDKARFRFVREVRDVFGQSPRTAMFSRGQVKVTLSTFGPNDPRCCPSSAKEYTILTE